MSQIINTNVMSLNAQRNLAASNNDLSTAIQRLSSGLRINSAKDDAAGLAISERFTTQIRGLDVAIRNANDGISLSQTAEGAMVEVSNNLQRIRELAVQASNATNSESDRKALQAEVDQLVNEIERVAKQTNFNNINLLDGSFTGAQFQVGANAGESITIAAAMDAKTTSLGSDAKPASRTFSGIPTPNTVSDTRSVGSNPTVDVTTWGYSQSAEHTVTLSVNGKNYTFQIGEISEAPNTAFGSKEAAVADYANRYSAAYKAAVAATPELNNLINVDIDPMTGGMTISAKDSDVPLTSLTTATTLSTVNDFLKVDDMPEGGLANNLSELKITTFEGAQRALALADAALNTVNGARAEMGAIQNRFQSTIANLTTTSENLSASRSRIRDADYAKETAELTRTQILQQAGTAMLAQANSLPNSVLSLLQQ